MSRPGFYVLRCPTSFRFWCTGMRHTEAGGWQVFLTNATAFRTRTEAIRALNGIQIDAITRRRIQIVPLAASVRSHIEPNHTEPQSA